MFPCRSQRKLGYSAMRKSSTSGVKRNVGRSGSRDMRNRYADRGSPSSFTATVYLGAHGDPIGCLLCIDTPVVRFSQSARGAFEAQFPRASTSMPSSAARPPIAMRPRNSGFPLSMRDDGAANERSQNPLIAGRRTFRIDHASDRRAILHRASRPGWNSTSITGG